MPDYPPELAIVPLDHPLDSRVRLPGSKSSTNRALVVAALATGGASRLEGPLEADDTVVMRACLRRLGVLIDDNDDPWLVLGTGGDLTAPDGPLDVGASGTTARFLTAVAALADGPVVIDGSPRMRLRPIAELVEAMTALGMRAESTGGYPPVTVYPGALLGGEALVDGSRSSQFVSALLMVAPMFDHEVVLRLRDGVLVSRPYVAGTVEVMRSFGAEVSEIEGGFVVAPTGYRKTHYAVEGDASAAAYPAVAAAITGGAVTLDGIPAGSIQPDLRLLDVLARMGCVVERHPTAITVRGPVGALEAVDVDMNEAPDAVLALSVACLFADGPSRIRDIGNLRLKETDRLLALEAEIGRLGGVATVDGDDLVVGPGALRGATVETYDDHRMAMAFSLVGLRVPGVVIRDPGCVAKTWPGYFEVLGRW